MAKVWKVSRVEYKTTGENGEKEIDTVHFKITDTQNGIKQTRSHFHHIDPSLDGSFTPMDDITDDQLLTWVKGTMGADGIAYEERKLDEQIKAVTTPPRGEKVFS